MSSSEPSVPPHVIRLAPARITWRLAGIVVALLALHVVLQTATYRGADIPWDLQDLFDLDEEQSVPTWFSAATLLFSSGLLLAIAGTKRRGGDRDARYWYGLSAGFAVMSLDEVAGLHELLNSTMSMTWTVPALGLVLAIMFLYARFLLRLPVATRWLIVVAGVTFVAGAVGVELLTNVLLNRKQLALDTLDYKLLTALEEGLEMFGSVLFLSAILRYMEASASRRSKVEIEIRS